MQNILYNQSGAEQQEGFFRRILWTVRKAVGGKRDHTDVIMEAIRFRSLGMFKEAVKSYKHAVRLNPSDAESYYNLGDAYEEMGKLDEAVSAYRQAVSLKSRYVDAMYKLSIAYGKLGMVNEAIEITKRAINMTPNFTRGYKNLSVFYGRKGMYREAVDSLHEALRLDPVDHDARYRLVISYLDMRDRNSAYSEYSILQKNCPRLAVKLSGRFAPAH